MAKVEIKQFINIYGEIITPFSGVQTEEMRVETKDSMKDGTKDQISDKAPPGRGGGGSYRNFTA